MAGAFTHNGNVVFGLPNDASQVNFNKTGTDLVATKVDNAIKEVNTKVNVLDVALEVPYRKNILPMTVSGIKSANRSGTWNGNTYTLSTITMTIDTDSNGNVESVTLNGTGNNNIYLAVSDKFTVNTNADVVLSGTNIGVNALYMSDETTATDITTAEFTTTAGHEYVSVYHATESSYNNFKLYPMLRPATITDPTFAPYIPSVESRIEAVESGSKLVGTYILNGMFQNSALYDRSFGVAFLGGYDPALHDVTINSARTLDGTSVTLTLNSYTCRRGSIGFYEDSVNLIGKLIELNVTIALK